MRHCFLLLAFLAITASACQPQSESKQTEGKMSSFVDDYFNAFFDCNPTYGTEIGFHQYDSRIEDLSAESFSRRIQQLKELRTRLAELREAR